MNDPQIVSVKAYFCFACSAFSLKPFPAIPPESAYHWHYKPNTETWCGNEPVEVVVRTVEVENGG